MVLGLKHRLPACTPFVDGDEDCCIRQTWSLKADPGRASTDTGGPTAVDTPPPPDVPPPDPWQQPNGDPWKTGSEGSVTSPSQEDFEQHSGFLFVLPSTPRYLSQCYAKEIEKALRHR